MSMDEDIRKELDREMEERCKRMTSLGSKAKVVTDTIKQTQDLQTRQRGVDRDKMQQNMRKRMQRKQQLRRKQSKVPNEVEFILFERKF